MGIRALILAALTIVIAAAAHAAIPEFTTVIVKTYPHDPQAFTEGLLFSNGFLYESTGLNGHSSVRKVALDTGAVVQEHDLPPQYFGEGIVIWKSKMVGLTYKTETGFVFDLATFNPISEFHYKGEGWGLTQDGSHLIMSDGTSDLRILDPETLAETSRIHVTCEGRPIRNINELEWVKGELYANIWLTNSIVRIDPKTGDVDGVVDVAALTALSGGDLTAKVPNGIAYDAGTDRLFVTGKLWPALYQITLSPRQGTDHPCQSLP